MSLSFSAFSVALASSNQYLTYQGRVVRPDGSLIDTGNLIFTISLYSPGAGHCLLYSETQTISMIGSKGLFALHIGSGTRTDSGSHSFNQVFVNNSTLSSLNCTTGTSYTSVTTDDRELEVSFNDAGTTVSLSSMKIKSVPFALQAHEIDGWGLSNIVKVSTLGSPTTFTTAEMANAKAITSASCSSGEVLKWNGTTWACATDITTGAATDAGYTAANKGIIAFDTDAATSGISVSAGLASVNVGTTANKIVKLDGSAKLPAVDGSALTNLDPTHLSAAVPIDKGGTGQITAILSFNALSPITTKGDLITSDGTNNVRLPAGSNGYVLTADSAQANGIKWAPVTAGTVTSVSSANADISVATGTSTPVLTLNSGTSANQIVKLDGSAKLPAVDGSALTNLNAGNISSGTLPVNRGGTGATTFGNNGVIVSNGTGSALQTLNCTSTQIITFDTSGYAICGAAPSSSDATKLPLAGGTMTGNLINNSNTATAALAVTQSGAGSVAILMGGNVGIGISTPAEKLEVNGAIKLGTTVNANAGTIRWDGTNFQGYNGTAWANFIPNPPASGACDTTNTYTTAGTYAYTVPAGFATITIRMWGGGGAGGNMSTVSPSSAGGTSSIVSLGLIAGGGTAGETRNTGTAVSYGNGGTASGGTVNTNGTNGGLPSGGFAGAGGASPNGGAGGAIVSGNMSGAAGGTPGGGGSGASYGGGPGYASGGGAGAYVEKTFTTATLLPGTTINDIVVGAAGAQAPFGYQGGPGGVGRVSIACSTTGAPAANDRGIIFLSSNQHQTDANFVYSASGNVGINTSSPSAKLEIIGSSGSTLKIVDGNQGAGKVLTSDANGVASWAATSGGGGSGTVTSVSSANTDIAVANGASTPVLTLNSGTGNNQIVKLDGSAKLPAVDGSALTNLNAGNIASGTLPISRGGTAATSFAANAVIVSNGTGAALQALNCTSGQVITFDVSGYAICGAAAGSTGFVNGGNSFGAGAILGTRDNNDLYIRTNDNTWMTILKTGEIGIGTSTPASPLELNASSTATSGTYITNKQFLDVAPAAASTAAYYNQYYTTDLSTNKAIGSVVGIYNEVTKSAGSPAEVYLQYNSFTTSNSFGSATISGIYGTKNDLSVSRSGMTTTNMYGTYNTLAAYLGTVTNAYGTYNAPLSGGGTFTNAYGSYNTITNAAGTITNGYGVYIGTVGATNKFSLYASDATAPSYYAGKVGIGTSAPSTLLDVAGTMATKASIEGISAYVNTSTAYTIPDTSVNIVRLTLTGNATITLPAFTSPAAKVFTLTVFLKQDSTGSRTMTFAGNGTDTVKWDSGAAPTISSTADKITILQFTKPSDETVWYGSMVWKEN